MNIPDLPPDLSFPKLGTAPEDQEFAFEVKRAAIGPFWAGATGPVAADEGRDGHLDAGAMGRGQELARSLPNDALIISSREPYGSTIVSKSGELVEQGSLL